MSHSEKIIVLDTSGQTIGWCKYRLKQDVFYNWNTSCDYLPENIIFENPESIYIQGISSNIKGTGSKLVYKLEDIARELQVEWITLSSITESIGFWTKLGYQIYSYGEFTYMFKKINSLHHK